MLILGATFLVPSQYSFPRLQLYVTKKYEIIFVPLCFYSRLLKKCSKSASQIFKILFYKLEILIFLSFVVSFVMSNICKSKVVFLAKKSHPQWNLGHTLVPKLSQKCALNSKLPTHRHTEIWFFNIFVFQKACLHKGVLKRETNLLFAIG